MNDYFIALGFILLYLPPLLVEYYQDIFDKVFNRIRCRWILALSTSLTLFMIYLMPDVPIFVFPFYLIAFTLIYLYYNKIFFVRGESLRIAIYSCFAISVLWEWPIQLIIYQNWIAVLMSGFKALGIPFLYLTLKNRGLKINRSIPGLLILSLIHGLILALTIHFFGINLAYYHLHAYRFMWFALIILLITETNIKFKQKRIVNRPGVDL